MRKTKELSHNVFSPTVTEP